VYKIYYRAGDNDLNLETARSVLVNVVDPAALAASKGVPVSAATNFSNGDTVIAGQTLTVTGAALDPDGGYIGGVEFSTDGGKTWTTASGTSNWSFNWTAPAQNGLETLLYRAGDNDYKLEIAHPLTLKVISPSQAPPGAAPVSSVSNLAEGEKISAGTTLHIQGAASDIDGTISKVEVSTDNGYTWKAATGSSNWSYDWNVPTDPQVLTFQFRAIDDSLNVESVHSILVQSIDPHLI